MTRMPTIEKDIELQKKYDEIINAPSEKSFLMRRYDPFEGEGLYLVSGQNSYFNKHIEENGLNHLRVEQSDANVIAMLHSLVLRYGSPNNYGKYDSILYVTPPGTIEVGYARQSFPSGILEDVFLWQGDKKFPYPWYTFHDEVESVDLVAGEPESEYWIRVAQKLIEIKKKDGKPIKFEDKEITEEQMDNFMVRVRNVLAKFCTWKNRLYFIPIEQVLNNKACWFAERLREGSISDEEIEREISSKRTIMQIINDYNEDAKSFLSRISSNGSQWGLALLGEIDGPVKYVEIKSLYSLLQEYFLNNGYKPGETIDYKDIKRLFEEKEQPDIVK